MAAGLLVALARGWRSIRFGLLALACALASVANAAPVVHFGATPIQGDVCVAPCAVHFDAIGDGAGSLSYDPDYPRPFHSLHFAWGFDDATPGTWAISGRSKQAATGAIAGHLYETPGTFDVALRVTNPAGVSRGVVVGDRITVADPDVVFANTTWCFANSGTPGGAGFEACPVRTASRHVVVGWQAGGFDQAISTCGAITSKSRCLFRAGDYFGARSAMRLSDTPGPGLLSRFGDGPNPVVFGGDGFVILRNGWTVAHFEVWLNDPGEAGALFLLSSYNGRVTVFDVKAPMVHNTCFESAISSTPAHSDLVGVVELECHARNSLTNAAGVYLRAERTLFLGNWIDNAYEGQFTLRTVHLPRSVIQHSRLERPGTSAGNRRNVMQLRAWAGSSSTGTIGPPPSPTEFVIVSDNVLSQDDAEVGIRTCQSNDCVDTPLATEMQDLIFERNFFTFSRGSGNPPGQMTRGFWLQGGDVTVRNNVFDLQGISTAPSEARTRLVWHDPNVASRPDLNDHRIQVLHNTVYFDDPSPNGFQICGGASGADHLCRNNLVFIPGASGPIDQVDVASAWSPGGNIFASTSPFARPIPGQGETDMLDFLLAPTSVARNTGWDPRTSAVSVWGDLQGRCRPEGGVSPATGGDWDVGAAEFESGVHCMVTPEPGTALLLGGGLAWLARRRRSVRAIT